MTTTYVPETVSRTWYVDMLSSDGMYLRTAPSVDLSEALDELIPSCERSAWTVEYITESGPDDQPDGWDTWLLMVDYSVNEDDEP